MELSVLPGINLAIRDHLFPYNLWASNNFYSSSMVHLSFFIEGFKWLCHLTINNLFKLVIPLSALFAPS